MNYLKLFEDGSTEATVELPTWGEISTTGDYHIDGLWYDKTGVLYTNQFTYLSNKGKLAGIEVANGIPVDLHYDELAPTLVEDTIKATNLVVTDGFDLGQSWVNVTASRSIGVTYTNTTGKPIFVNVSVAGLCTTSQMFKIYVDSVEVCKISWDSGASAFVGLSNSFVVPDGKSYSVVRFSGSQAYIAAWSELR